MHSVSFYSFAFLLVFLVFTTTNVLGNDFRYPSRDVMKAMLRDPKAYFRGEPIRFGKKSSFREPIRFGKRMTNNEKLESGEIEKNIDNDESHDVPLSYYSFL